MNWYLTKIIYRIVQENEITAQFDEQLRLVKAIDEQQAFAKAIKIGKQEEDVFVNQAKLKVQWKFVNVVLVSNLVSITDGMELYSTISEKEEPENYTYTVHQKAKAYNYKSISVK